jgi:beta-glucanase (GH16 family)
MRAGETLSVIPLLLTILMCACGGDSSATAGTPAQTQVAAPSVTTKAAQAGAQIVTLTAASGATIHYTVDGSTPASASPVYQAPFLVSSNLTLNAYATAAGQQDSKVTTQAFTPNIASGTLVWSDEFTNASGSNQQPDPTVWGYDTGASGWGNHELEDYCAWNSSAAPCDPANPNAYVGTDGYLHIVARKTAAGGYTSARMKSQGLFSIQYGRLEARIWAPEGQGLWPAFWTLGNNIVTAKWPASGEQDIMERVDAALTPDWNEGSVHGTGFTGNAGLGTKFYFPAGQTAAGWHTYGMIWKKGSVAYYVDDPANPYVTYTNPESLSGLSGAVWPFDSGDSAFILMNLAVGGDWPGNPDGTAVFPESILVDYVRVYTN